MMRTDFSEQRCFYKSDWRELIPVAQQAAKEQIGQRKRHDQVWIRRSASAFEERRSGELKGELFFLLRSVLVDLFKRCTPSPLLPALRSTQNTHDRQFSPHQLKAQARGRQEIARQDRVE